jgi:asparagine synthase (glutamine-hydrolysing)
MCGIAGIIGNRAQPDNLQKMLTSQAHRGPDYSGIVQDSDVAVLGHNRLSIIDLTGNANQPFIDKSENFILVFNGEIYNYLELKLVLKPHYDFVTNSDTEVLLAAYIVWGKECLYRLNGMFSFAIWDKKNKRLFAARDRFGVKPFYYIQAKHSFYFASEIKAIQTLGVGLDFNEHVWSAYFNEGSYGMPNETFYKEVLQLPGGSYLTFDSNKLSVIKWYDFENEVRSISVAENEEEIKHRYIQLLKDSISLRFRADVPVGFNISGGLDSSALLCFVNQINKDNVKAFTFYTGDDRYDELPWVEQMIALTNNPLHKVKISPEEIPDLAKKIAHIQDEPFGGIPTLAYAKLFKEARAEKVKVLLDGQGMDEQWAGYDYYRNNNDQVIQGVSKSPFRPGCLATDFRNITTEFNYPKPFDSRVKNLQYRDLFYTKIPRALRFNDRVSMAFSTELREPFLDHRLVAYAFAQKETFKIKGEQSKYLLRQIVSDYLSDSITFTPKRPLQTPQREWLGDDLRGFVSKSIEKLLDSKYHNWFEKDVLNKEWNTYIAGDRDASFHIWQWVNLSLLLR